jgi:hypothetical protein
MSKLLRNTKVIANGKQGESDVHFGWLAKAIVATLLSLGVLGIERLFVISTKIEVLDERTTRTAIALTALEIELRARVDKAALEHTSFLTHDEFATWLHKSHMEPNANRNFRYRSY